MGRSYDLEQRTQELGKQVFLLVKRVSVGIYTRNIIQQVLRSATSIAANYMEADVAESKKDFLHKIGICKKEAKETTYWLSILALAEPALETPCCEARQEAHELMLIFSSIVTRTRQNQGSLKV